MILLLPVSVVALATTLRGFSVLSAKSVSLMENQVCESVEKSFNANRQLTVTDVRDIAYDKALSVYSIIQPLSILYSIAPIIGVLGSVVTLMTGNMKFGKSGDIVKLSESLENSFIPCIWGIGIALVSLLGFGFLKSRLFKIESQVLVPVALEKHASLLQGEKLKPGNPFKR